MLAKEGYSTIAAVLIFSLIAGFLSTLGPSWLQWPVITGLLLFVALITYFFRDPERRTPESSGAVISPADGKVVSIKKVTEEEYMQSEGIQVSIFLSPLDVHVNRVPVSGKIEYLKYHPGKYLMAWEDHASEMNERAHFGVLQPDGKRILFKQITGFLARRIVYHLKKGDEVQAGDRFGIMKFGSRMDIILPVDADVTVMEGDRTVAGESLIARL
mgnify:FL=1